MSEDMHSLLGLYFSGQASEGEAEAVRQWLDVNKENQAEFSYMEKLWDRSGELPAVSFDTSKAWKEINNRINGPVQKTQRIKLYVRWFTKAAAVLVLALIIPRLINTKTGMRTELADTEVRTVQLEDGSKVYLRKGSSLQFPVTFDRDRRGVSLEGEAFFEIAPNAASPFIIKAAATEVRVVGTSFSVNTAGNKVELIVKTGRVNFHPIADTSGQIVVIAGERAVYEGVSMIKQLNTDDNFNAWQSKRLEFKTTPLEQVAIVLSEYYNITIRLRKEDASRISATAITATFDNQELPSVLNELSLITTYRIQKISGTDYEISLQ